MSYTTIAATDIEHLKQENKLGNKYKHTPM